MTLQVALLVVDRPDTLSLQACFVDAYSKPEGGSMFLGWIGQCQGRGDSANRMPLPRGLAARGGSRQNIPAFGVKEKERVSYALFTRRLL